jgi:SET domain-containing protein
VSIISSSKTYIDQAPKKGRGVFAIYDMDEGTIIEIAPVLIIPEEDNDLVYTSFLTDYWYEVLAEENNSAIALGHASMYNHEDDPNAEYEIDADKKLITITAIKPIHAKEEITVSYGFHPIKAKFYDELEDNLNNLRSLELQAKKSENWELAQALQGSIGRIQKSYEEVLRLD